MAAGPPGRCGPAGSRLPASMCVWRGQGASFIPTNEPPEIQRISRSCDVGGGLQHCRCCFNHDGCNSMEAIAAASQPPCNKTSLADCMLSQFLRTKCVGRPPSPITSNAPAGRRGRACACKTGSDVPAAAAFLGGPAPRASLMLLPQLAPLPAKRGSDPALLTDSDLSSGGCCCCWNRVSFSQGGGNGTPGC